ncbi:hypothetical protein M404DRAFT_998704 [Pisolithus tinctorius Marx 270]|uniref:Uncharacterized protein n=1 Tax=Pisolithus tinctorius Marx 270 TaxID=870435 RepID=A0A0C3PED7_PISTI|nr:hypothetical protein M404DRAFT_998704 [Pisolithus tinctorius Marx 270]
MRRATPPQTPSKAKRGHAMMLRMNAFGPQARRRIRSYSNANHQSTVRPSRS